MLAGLVPSEYFLTKIVLCIYLTNKYKYLVSIPRFCFEEIKETTGDQSPLCDAATQSRFILSFMEVGK